MAQNDLDVFFIVRNFIEILVRSHLALLTLLQQRKLNMMTARTSSQTDAVDQLRNSHYCSSD